ncbi:hypothetical protein D5F01_LYC22410 [Larimichthys crocea]|uniref:Uncharacterized protein n=1 Tax=Larimichthys crocea TaxID=215358 RepID=A0A6G0HIC0_LARCR|nr:hypothetical protein D5F01_LYC22410 [Larimichthys crocea]
MQENEAAMAIVSGNEDIKIVIDGTEVLKLHALKVNPDLESCPFQQTPAMSGAMGGYDEPDQHVKEEEEEEYGDVVLPASPPPSAPPVFKSSTHTMQTRQQASKTDTPTASTFPMVEVAGLDGPILVHRPWTAADELKYEGFWQRDLGQETCFKISQRIPRPELKIVHVDWAHAKNMEYRDALLELGDALRKVFPPKVDMSKIASCKQKPEEQVNDYVSRLTAILTNIVGWSSQGSVRSLMHGRATLQFHPRRGSMVEDTAEAVDAGEKEVVEEADDEVSTDKALKIPTPVTGVAKLDTGLETVP